MLCAGACWVCALILTCAVKEILQRRSIDPIPLHIWSAAPLAFPSEPSQRFSPFPSWLAMPLRFSLFGLT